jgi:DNA-binding NtrC family response regulator
MLVEYSLSNNKAMNKKLNKKIFVVDDDWFVTTYLEQTLKNIGYSDIATYASGKDCLKHIHHNPQVVFLDYQMDNMDGLDVLKEIKNYFPGISVVFTTGLEDLSVAVASISNGSFDFLLKKNITEDEVSNILERIEESQENNQLFI